MAKQVKIKEIDQTAENKIKEAARVVFLKKGYSATRTRDIAEEAGMNLALLNYYFRSKENLFNIVMFDTMHAFFKSLGDVFNDTNTSLETKIEQLADRYISLLIINPDIPVFIMNEMRSQPEEILEKMGIKKMLMHSEFIKQFHQSILEKKIKQINPLHFIMNTMGMIVFPFIARPMLRSLGDLEEAEFEKLMQERKTLIPRWILGALKGN